MPDVVSAGHAQANVHSALRSETPKPMRLSALRASDESAEVSVDSARAAILAPIYLKISPADAGWLDLVGYYFTAEERCNQWSHCTGIV
jgi:hypothetical protein